MSCVSCTLVVSEGDLHASIRKCPAVCEMKLKACGVPLSDDYEDGGNTSWFSFIIYADIHVTKFACGPDLSPLLSNRSWDCKESKDAGERGLRAEREWHSCWYLIIFLHIWGSIWWVKSQVLSDS